jgi:taurine dioxygenase
MRNTAIEVRRASGSTGVIISGIDLSEPLDNKACQEIRDALNQYSVVFFRDQNITPEQHLALAQCFGEIRASRVVKSVPGHPLVMELRKEPEQIHGHGGKWHTDQAFEEKPPLGSILLARETPNGGDTMFASMYNAYDTLSDGLKETLRGMRAVHTARKNKSEYASRKAASARDPAKLAPNEVDQEWVHPVTPVHPESDRRLLFVNPTYTERFDGWTEEESAPLLNYLCQHASRPENICRFQWKPGSIAFWDNRSCWHYAVQDYNGQRRVMHRVTVKGGGFGAQ